ncbi:MAG: 50S ribosomal protein L21 [Candidatus Omnitrophota bacterium]
MYAVIETGGKQYSVSTGTKLKVEKLPVPKDGEVIFERVLLFVSDQGEVVADSAKLSGIKVKAKVIEEGKNKKVLVFKRKSKKDYQKAFGHRQPYSRIEVVDIIQK